ncbi:MAG: D-aminoacylase [Gemmatimonadetes bacterium]|nr:D-aminoacylase [Gemmatimonadota bacterium]
MRLAALLIAIVLSSLGVRPSTAAAQQRPCTSDEHRHFDFWAGRWVVRAANGALAGHNTLSPILGECVLREHYTTPSGYEGESFNVFDRTRGVWHQTWVDNQGALLTLEGGYVEDRMVMEGETVDTAGVVTLNRITWSRIDGGRDRVRQFWESSTDGGTTWGVAFDGSYIRQETSVDWDILIRGGTVLDGSGGPGFTADVAISGDRIARVSPTPLDPARATRVIEATGMVVSPGFVDLHTHLDPLMRLPGAESHVRQGVTTALGGPDGRGPWPFAPYLAEAEALGVGMNVGFMAGHNTVRRAVMGLEDRAPTTAELKSMQDMVAQSMDEGAWGISTGLKYLPGAFSELDEVVALSEVVGQKGGFYTSHLREEGLGLLQGVSEALEIGRRADIPIVLTHHKVVGQPMWGSSVTTLAMVDSARAAGTDAMIDQYPYTASYTGITILVPAWALADGTQALLSRMEDPALADSILAGIEFNIINDRGGNDLRRVQMALVPWDRSLEGKTLHDWALRDGLQSTPATGAKLVIEAVRRGGVSAIFHAMDEADVARIMAHPFTMIASDGRLTQPGEGSPHPRWYGTFPRVLGHYARDEGVISLEQAVRKMTTMPAERMGLRERGQLREGWYADAVVFDPATVTDNATFSDPHQYPTGIDWVIVNGSLAVDGAVFQDIRPGRVLRRGHN